MPHTTENLHRLSHSGLRKVVTNITLMIAPNATLNIDTIFGLGKYFADLINCANYCCNPYRGLKLYTWSNFYPIP